MYVSIVANMKYQNQVRFDDTIPSAPEAPPSYYSICPSNEEEQNRENQRNNLQEQQGKKQTKKSFNGSLIAAVGLLIFMGTLLIIYGVRSSGFDEDDGPYTITVLNWSHVPQNTSIEYEKLLLYLKLIPTGSNGTIFISNGSFSNESTDSSDIYIPYTIHTFSSEAEMLYSLENYTRNPSNIHLTDSYLNSGYYHHRPWYGGHSSPLVNMLLLQSLARGGHSRFGTKSIGSHLAGKSTGWSSGLGLGGYPGGQIGSSRGRGGGSRGGGRGGGRGGKG